MAEATQGRWGPTFQMPNVMIHATLLHTGKILWWGRRFDTTSTEPASLNQGQVTYLFDPVTRTNKPTGTEPGANLFCAGHNVLPNGDVFVAGGHIRDTVGLNHACTYSPDSDTWTTRAQMNHGRWYPSNVTLSDGSAFVISGSYLDENNQVPNDIIPQIWRANNTWTEISSQTIMLKYPRLHVGPSGRILMAGPQAQGLFLNLNQQTNGTQGAWTSANNPPLRRSAGAREYGSGVMYDFGKILYTGGGNNGSPAGPPTNICEVINLAAGGQSWATTGSMNFPRRMHNATVLPNGTVLVTGGTRGGGFNNVAPGSPVHGAEIWNPATGAWTNMAAESTDRCYHSTALLLPDGRVISAGGGEYALGGNPNPARDTHTNAQFFNPPYLFIPGARPTIVTAPNAIKLASGPFQVTVGANDVIAKASWIRLGSVTHSNNMNQGLIFLNIAAAQQGNRLSLNAPVNKNITPPGHYMLFLLNRAGKPSVAKIIRLDAAAGVAITDTDGSNPLPPPGVNPDLPFINDEILDEQDGPAVVVGLTPVCYYGLGGCWGGAYEGLLQISDLQAVRPIPDQFNNVGFVYLKEDKLPDVEEWLTEFRSTARGSYDIRGIQMTFTSTVSKKGNQLILKGTATRQDLTLEPFKPEDNLNWDTITRQTKPITEAEANAFSELSKAVGDNPDGTSVKVTGKLIKLSNNDFSLHVRKFTVLAEDSRFSWIVVNDQKRVSG